MEAGKADTFGTDVMEVDEDMTLDLVLTSITGTEAVALFLRPDLAGTQDTLISVSDWEAVDAALSTVGAGAGSLDSELLNLKDKKEAAPTRRTAPHRGKGVCKYSHIRFKVSRIKNIDPPSHKY